MEDSIDHFPTPIARVEQRLKAIGLESSADSFLLISYLVEATVKAIAICLNAGIRSGSSSTAYANAHFLVRADGLGDWGDAIDRMSSHPQAGYLPADFHQLLAWLTRKRTANGVFSATTAAHINLVRSAIGMDELDERNITTVRHLIRELVIVRNKTKAHGAFGPDFFSAVNPHYHEMINVLVSSCPLFQCDWLHLSIRLAKGNVRGIRLVGPTATYMRDADAALIRFSDPGVYIIPGHTRRAFWLGDLLRCNQECSEYQFPNGNFKTDATAEFIDYASGRTCQTPLPQLVSPPAPLKVSETHGLTGLDIQSNVFGNLPATPKNYVERLAMHSELVARLRDKNHTIITLHGRGGTGKTWLALRVAHEIASESEPIFEFIVWFSARDVDLRLAGPAPVRPAVTNLTAICRSYGDLFDMDKSIESFAHVLATPEQATGKGRLFIFDNFETLDDARGIHQFLDTHTHLPNKVLITSRERAFKADYPIEVRGMEFDEAVTMLRLNSHELGIGGILTDEVIQGIYEYTEGHPYIMRLLLGEIAKEGKYISPKSLLPRRLDVVQAVFERSFNKLSDAGRWVFLLVANWRSRVPEVALFVVCGQRGLDVESGIEECLRLSLIEREELADSQPCYWAPEVARLFARKKLESDFDRLLIQEDAQVLHRFGALSSINTPNIAQEEVVQRFVSWARQEARADRSQIGRLDNLLLSIAELYPSVWNDLVDFRISNGGDISYALRRLVEERPFDKKAWLRRAQYAKDSKDDRTYIASLVSAVDAAPQDVELIRETANQVCRYIDDHKHEIPAARRGVYLAGSHPGTRFFQESSSGSRRWAGIISG